MKPHVLPHKTLVTVIRKSWTTLWMTRIGGCIPLQRLNVDAQVIGKFFQEVMALELHAADPRWRHPDAPRSPKDPVFKSPGSRSDNKTRAKPCVSIRRVCRFRLLAFECFV